MDTVNCGYDPPSRNKAKAAAEVDCGFAPRSQAAKAVEAPVKAAPKKERPVGVTVRSTT